MREESSHLEGRTERLTRLTVMVVNHEDSHSVIGYGDDLLLAMICQPFSKYFTYYVVKYIFHM